MSFEALASKIKHILRDEDIEGLIETGAPEDEYDSEASIIAMEIASLGRDQATLPNFTAIIAAIWAKAFNLDGEGIGKRIAAFQRVASKLL